MFNNKWIKITCTVLLISCFYSCSKKATTEPLPSKDLPLQEKLTQYLKDSEEKGFAGNVLVAVKGSIVLKESYGFLDKEASIKNDESTVFTTGSITKQFTGAAILTLVMKNLVSVTDPVGKYLPSLERRKSSFNPPSAIDPFCGLKGALGRDNVFLTDGAFLQLVNESEFKFTPGEKYHYSNVGYSFWQ